MAARELVKEILSSFRRDTGLRSVEAVRWEGGGVVILGPAEEFIPLAGNSRAAGVAPGKPRARR